MRRVKERANEEKVYEEKANEKTVNEEILKIKRKQSKFIFRASNAPKDTDF